MTDFRHTSPICVEPGTRLEDALNRMIYAGVRLLFVKGARTALLGHVTAADIQGEKPLLYLQSGDCRQDVCRWHDVRVEDIMTRVAHWRVLDFADVMHATAADIAATHERLCAHHLIVCERGGQGWTVRGLFSATRTACQLCEPVAISSA